MDAMFCAALLASPRRLSRVLGSAGMTTSFRIT